MAKKKVLITAFIGSRNLGDEAIFKSILQNLDLEDIVLTALTINEAKTKKLGVKTVYAKRIPNIKRAIKESDVILMGGGGIIQDQSSILNLFYYAYQLWLAKRFNKPVILCFVGVGPLKHKISRLIIKQVISIVEFAVVRDEQSKKILIEAGLSSEFINAVSDPVLNYKGNINSDDITQKNEYVVLSLRRWFFSMPLFPASLARRVNRHWPFGKRYTKFIQSVARNLDKYLEANPNRNIVAVSMYDSEDVSVNRDLLKHMVYSKRVKLAPINMSEDQYLGIVKGSTFVVGMRLHALILGSTIGVPFVALKYSSKVDQFAKQTRLLDYAVSVDSVGEDNIYSAMDRLDKNIASAGKLTISCIRKLQSSNAKAFTTINKLLKEL